MELNISELTRFSASNPPDPAHGPAPATSAAASRDGGDRQDTSPAPASSTIAAGIERLTLRGFPPLNLRHFQDAFAAEFTRLAPGLAHQLADPIRMDRLPALTLKLPGTCDARTLGRELARALASALGQTNDAR